MQAGKSNKQPWVNQLDQLSPGESSSFDKASTWEKLHGRLHSKKEKRKNTAWVWWTAASVAASLILYFSLFEKSTQPAEKTNIVSGTGIDNNKSMPPAKQESQPLSSKEIKHIEVIDKNKTDYNVEVRTNTGKEEQPVNDEKIQTASTEIPEVPLDAISGCDTISVKPVAPAIPVAVKKKLRVVHNNELAGSGAPITIIEKNTTAVNTGNFFPGFRKPVIENEEAFIGDTVKTVKVRRSILPFSGLISQKE